MSMTAAELLEAALDGTLQDDDATTEQPDASTSGAARATATARARSGVTETGDSTERLLIMTAYSSGAAEQTGLQWRAVQQQK